MDMLEAIIGGFVGAIVGAFAGGYATYKAERWLDRARQGEETMEWMLNEMDTLKSDMLGMSIKGTARYYMTPQDSIGHIQGIAAKIRGRIHELDDSGMREEMYTLFEKHYDNKAAMVKAIKDQREKMHKKRRAELREVQKDLHGEAGFDAMWEVEKTTKDGTWPMPPKHAWKLKALKDIKDRGNVM